MIANSINISGRKALIFGLLSAALFMFKPLQCQAKDKLNIVTTTTNLESITRAVGGKHVNVSAISTGREDPHYISAKPSYMLKAKKADLWIRVGLDLEIGYERLILEGSRNPRIHLGLPGHLDVSERIIPLDVPTQRISHSMGDVHPLGNPHYWLDPYNARIIAKTICKRLKQLDPANSADYDRNSTAFLLRLDNAMFGSRLAEQIEGEKLWELLLNYQLDNFIREKSLSLGGWLARLKPFEGSKIVAYHHSWVYFEHRFGLNVVAELEPKPGIPPGPAHILDVISNMKSQKAGIILMEPYYNRRDAEAVAKKTNAAVVVVATAVNGQKEAFDYIAMFDNIVTQLSNALSEVSN